jgi:NifB/MoaA-like Fe-S oxidoreductase
VIRYRPDFMGGEMEECGDGDFVLASEAEGVTLRSRKEGFEECRQAVLSLLNEIAARYDSESGAYDALAEIQDPLFGQEDLS